MDKNVQMALQINKLLQTTLKNAKFDDSQAMEFADLYPKWQPNVSYQVDDIVSYGVNEDNETQLWKVVQAHTSQADWTPDKAPSLFSKIGFDESGVQIWTQPLGAHDAYNTGDIVMHNGVKYKSTVDGNVWEPGVYGWEVVEE